MRKICYISGTRADFGLMKNTLQIINKDKDLDLEIIATGMHLLSEYGNTCQEIYDAGLNVISKVKVEISCI
jgi:GDP/UDP-N,N'-diacetylbacillosamine 2-epimerase (hydrolysing)